MRRLPSLLLILLCSSPHARAQAPTPPPQTASRADVSSLEAIMAATYDAISGPAGQPRNWDRFRSLFVPGARLISAVATKEGGAEARVLTVEDYIARSGPRLEKQQFPTAEGR